MADLPTPRKRPFLWVPTLYFAEGLPYSAVILVSSVFFKDHGASLKAIGLTSLFGLPWVFKFLWGPFIDEFATKRRWVLTMETLLVLSFLLMAIGSTLPEALAVGSAIFLLTAFLSATHDISVDGYYLEALDKKEQAGYVGFQAMSYRAAMIVGGGGVIYLSAKFGWGKAFTIVAAGVLAIMVYHWFILPQLEQRRRPAMEILKVLCRPAALIALGVAAVSGFLIYRLWQMGALARGLSALGPWTKRIELPDVIALTLFLALVALAVSVNTIKRRLQASNSFYALAFLDYLDQPRIGVILAFVVLYRNGESFLLNMIYPFLSDIGLTKAQYSVAYNTFGIIASICGGLLGGWLISRYGLRRMIWPFVFCQNALNLLYMFLAFHYRPVAVHRAVHILDIAGDITNAPFAFVRASFDLAAHPETWGPNLWLVTGIIIVEAVGSGLGTAAFMVFIMRTCKPRYKAANMAVATGVMRVCATYAGVFSGFLASWLGFPLYFGFTFLATVPSMVLIFFIPHLDAPPAAATTPSPVET